MPNGSTVSNLKSLILENNPNTLADNAPLDPRFQAHYDRYIRPKVDEFEAKRIEALGTLRKRLTLAIPVVIGAAVVLLGIAGSLFQLVIAGAIFAFGWAFWPVLLYKGSIKTEIFPNIFNFYGSEWHYDAYGLNDPSSIRLESKNFAGKNLMGIYGELKNTAKATHTINKSTRTTIMDPYMAFGILPTHETASTHDLLRGNYKQVPMALLQCTLQSTSGSGDDSRTHTDFRGLIITINVPKRFTGHTTVRRDRGNLGNWFGKQFAGSLAPVKLEDPRFEARYEVYGTDQVEARYLLTTTFMERLIALEELFISHAGGNCDIQCAFKDGKLLLTIPTLKPWFTTGSIFKPANFIPEINLILKEMEQLFAIVDVLQLDDRTGL